jgi:hypothetical protein
LLGVRSKIAATRWSGSAASAAADVITEIDHATIAVELDPQATYFALFDQEMINGLPMAANALRSQLGLPPIPPGCTDCSWFSEPL